MKLTAQQMRSLPEFFRQVTDPRRAQGRRHQIDVVLAIASAAVRHARLQGHLRLDARPGTQGARPVSMPLPQWKI